MHIYIQYIHTIHTYIHAYTHIHTYNTYHYGLRYIIQEQNYKRFDKKFDRTCCSEVSNGTYTEDIASLDSNLATHIKETGDIESVIEKLKDAVTLSCSKSFKTRENTKKMTKQNRSHGGQRNLPSKGKN